MGETPQETNPGLPAPLKSTPTNLDLEIVLKLMIISRNKQKYDIVTLRISSVKILRIFRVMLKRYSDRLTVNFEGKLILGEKNYTGVIENFSEEGTKIRTLSEDIPGDITPGTTLDLQIRIPPGETMNLPPGEILSACSEEMLNLCSEQILTLNCKVIWLDGKTDGLTTDIGLEIIEKSPAFEELFKSLFSNNMGL